ncbi:MAG: prepilin-type N-terminal cleavage/methylation domain-containing protein, partial [Coxiellaceae bacterium]|nr:prepilin-type N-terminal cleavage/methylation domain-containing protein [Coxiellaceae bacterium]
MTRNEKGISLLEMLLVLAIGAAIIMAAVRYFTITNRNARVTQAISQIKMLTKASYEWLSEQKQQDFSSVNGGVTVSLQQ